MLLEAVKEQQAQIRQLQSEVEGLKKAVTSDEWRVKSQSEPRPVLRQGTVLALSAVEGSTVP